MIAVLLPLLLVSSSVAPTSPDTARPDTVTFVVDMRGPIEAGWFDPSLETVGVRGGTAPLSWGQSIPATDEDADGRYTAHLAFDVPPGESLLVAYKFKVDGTGNPNDGWQEGRNRTVIVASGEPARVEAGFADPPPPLPSTLTGDVRHHEEVSSSFLEPARDVFVYLPPGYDDDPERRYPVLYLHDGQNQFDASHAGAEWRMDEAAEALIQSGEIEPVILVGVASTGDRTDEYTPTPRTWHFDLTRVGEAPQADGLARFAGTFEVDAERRLELAVQGDTLIALMPEEQTWVPLERTDPLAFYLPRAGITLSFKADADGAIVGISADKPPEGGRGADYGRFLVEELKPMIDQTYRTLPDQAALGGSSFGGLITMYLGLRYPGVFDQLLVVSPSVWWDNEVLLDEVEALKRHTGQRVWLDMGTGEGAGMLSGARKLRAALLRKGWTEGDDLVYVEAKDAPHSEAAWAERAPAMLTFLYGTDLKDEG